MKVWTCDSAAYLLGKRFGKAKILPEVSPKKTIVGSVSGVVGALGAVFGVLVLTFLALAYLEDEFDEAEVVWFNSRVATGAFWGATGFAASTV